MRYELLIYGDESSMAALSAQEQEAITAPYGGYADAADYYARSSAGPWLAAIDRPALVLAAADDPMIPGESLTRWPLLVTTKNVSRATREIVRSLS